MTSPYFLAVNVESSAAMVPQAVVRPEFIVGKSEKGENLMMRTDFNYNVLGRAPVLNACSFLNHMRMQKCQMLHCLRCWQERVLMIMMMFFTFLACFL